MKDSFASAGDAPTDDDNNYKQETSLSSQVCLGCGDLDVDHFSIRGSATTKESIQRIVRNPKHESCRLMEGNLGGGSQQQK